MKIKFSLILVWLFISCHHNPQQSESSESYDNTGSELNSTTYRWSEDDDNESSETDESVDTEDDNGAIEEDNAGDDDNNEKYPDDTYNAEVKYYNPNTGTHSIYHLTIEVENNEVVRINFPNGGWMDEDHFDGAELDEDGNAEFISDKGYRYNVSITD